MSTRKNSKFNKVTGYKDFTFSRTKLDTEVSNKTDYSKNTNFPENTLESKSDSIPRK